jgi:NAD-dependent SIR2 family protein deacetylase
MSILRDSRKLVRCYTQNIDQLEERVGLKTSLELGAGNRYRFSNRTGRRSVGTKGPLGEAETSNLPLSQQGESLEDQPMECKTEDRKPHQSEPGKSDSQQEGGELSQPSGSGADPAPEEAAAPAPAGPNRGVECVYLHGSLAVLRCFQCGRTSQWDDETRIADTMAGRQPDCPHCAGATAARQERGKRALGVGKLRPDIVLYGEEHPHAHLISPLVQHDLSLGPDLLLILGTSMRVHGLKVLVKEFAKAVHDRGGSVVFVNFTKPPDSVWADVIDYWVQWDCDAWVSDLQKRKPALWLPPGTTLPSAERVKAVKAPRRSSTGDAVKRKDSSKAASKRKVANASSSNKTGEETEAPSEAVIEVGQPFLSGDALEGPPSQEGGPRRKGSLKASAPKLLGAPRVVKERKLNPDAKRPASTRDHKQNGAYLTWKIGKLLREAAYGRPNPDIASSPVAPVQPKPRAKKARKSAPAALGSREPTEPTEPSQLNPTMTPQATSSEGYIAGVEHLEAKPEEPVHRGTTLPARDPPPAMGIRTTPQVPTSPPAPGLDDSISAAVKNRKRKRNVTWRKINGVETPVSADGAKEEGKKAGSQLHNKALVKVAPTPRPAAEPVADRRLPPPQTPPQRYPPRQFRDGFGSAGFVETDAKLSEAWAGVGLPPVVIRPSGRSAPRPKLQPMEPLVSPAPSLEVLSPNVGGPVRWRCPPNPFFLSDPLAGQFGWQPLAWTSQARPPPVREEASWNPEEQLRQEAALMLSSMRCQQ